MMVLDHVSLGALVEEHCTLDDLAEDAGGRHDWWCRV